MKKITSISISEKTHKSLVREHLKEQRDKNVDTSFSSFLNKRLYDIANSSNGKCNKI